MGCGNLLLMHLRKQLLISSGCTFLNLCFCHCHPYCWSDGLFDGFEFWFMQSSAYWVLENSEWHEASALPCINCFHLVYWNSSCYSKMGLISITQDEKGTTNFKAISLKIAKVISRTIQLWAKQTISWLNCYFFQVLKSFLTPVCQTKNKSRAFTDIGLLSIDSCWKGALCKTNREKYQSKVIFKLGKLLQQKKISKPFSIATTCSWQSKKYLPLPFNAFLPECHRYTKEERDWADGKHSILIIPSLINSFGLLNFDGNTCISLMI